MIGTIGAVIIIAIGAAICWGMYQVICDMDMDASPAKVYPLSDDDAALQAHFIAAEKFRAADLRRCSEAIRRHYEGITWPAMCWEVKLREFRRHVPTMSDVA